VGEVDRDVRAHERGNDPAEGERKVGNREPRARVAHERAQEERLPEAGVSHRDGERQLVEDCHAAEDALEDDCEQGEQTERTHARTRLADDDRQREDEGEAADQRRR